MEDEREQQDDDDAEATEDLEVGEEAENITGGLRSNPDAGGHLA